MAFQQILLTYNSGGVNVFFRRVDTYPNCKTEHPQTIKALQPTKVPTLISHHNHWGKTIWNSSCVGLIIQFSALGEPNEWQLFNTRRT
jgi:hypothetical protein